MKLSFTIFFAFILSGLSMAQAGNDRLTEVKKLSAKEGDGIGRAHV